MAAPPFVKKASKRRLDAALPSNKASNTKKGGVATFRNPGNKAGQGLMQQVDGAAEEGAETPAPTALGMLAQMASKKPKTKVQPAAGRKIAAMKLAKLRK